MSVSLDCDCGKRLNVPEKYIGQRVKCPSCSTALVVPSPSESSSESYLGAPLPSDSRPRRYSIDEFVRTNAEIDHGEGLFELEGDRMLEINLDGKVWTKKGSMVAYLGDIKFTREGILEHGVGQLLKKSISGEGVKLTKAEGNGALYLADSGKKISIIELQDESIFVNGNDVLAFEFGIAHDIKLMKRIAGMLAGGLFNVKLTGTGMIAITTHFDPLALRVTPDRPVLTDPNATVAWSGTLSPTIKTDISLKTFFGRGSGESIQLKFEGDGFVLVQPYEEAYFQAAH